MRNIHFNVLLKKCITLFKAIKINENNILEIISSRSLQIYFLQNRLVDCTSEMLEYKNMNTDTRTRVSHVNNNQ